MFASCTFFSCRFSSNSHSLYHHLKLHAETHPCFKFARYLVRLPHARRVHVWIELFFDEALMEAKQTRLHATMRGMNLPSRLRDAIDRIITLFICPVSYVVHIACAFLFFDASGMHTVLSSAAHHVLVRFESQTPTTRTYSRGCRPSLRK